MPDNPGWPEIDGDIRAEKDLPRNRVAALADIVNEPEKLEDEPSRGCTKLTPVIPIVGFSTVSMLPRLIFPGETDKFANENPSLRIARLLTVIEVSPKGLILKSSEPRLVIVCVPVAMGSNEN